MNSTYGTVHVRAYRLSKRMLISMQDISDAPGPAEDTLHTTMWLRGG